MRHERPLSFALLIVLVLSMTAFRGCDEGQRRSVEQNVVTGLRVAARAVEPGIETMRALREAGEVDAPTNLALARAALDVNSAARRFSQAALDGSDAEDLRGQLEALVDLASNLERDGTLKIKSGKTKLVFQLGVVAAKSGLSIALDEFKAGGGLGLSFTLNEETRKALEDLKPVFDKNDRLLREVVARLEGQ